MSAARRKCGLLPGLDASGLGWYAFIAGVLTTFALMGLTHYVRGLAQSMDVVYKTDALAMVASTSPGAICLGGRADEYETIVANRFFWSCGFYCCAQVASIRKHLRDLDACGIVTGWYTSDNVTDAITKRPPHTLEGLKTSSGLSKQASPT